MRWRVVVPLAVAIAVAGGAGFVVVDRNVLTAHSSAPAVALTPSRAPVLAALASDAPPPTRAAVAAALVTSLKAFPAGELVSGMVVDVETGRTLWSHAARTPAAPASTLKLLTAAAALRTLGPSFRFTTSVKRLGDTLYLVGGGDPTLVNSTSRTDVPVAYPRPASLTDLAAQTAAAVGAGRPIRLRVDLSAWSGPALAQGWLHNYIGEGDVTEPGPLELDGGRLHPAEFTSPRTTDPSGQAAAAFVTLLRKDGVRVSGTASRQTAPPAATQVATVSSPPLAELVQRMLTDSDNDLAEALGRAVAVKAGEPPTFVGAAAAVGKAVASWGVKPAELSLHDASGLSHEDEVAPAALVSVLRAAATGSRGVLEPMLDGLPVAGFTGTLADRYRHKDRAGGAGLVRAKTGSLTGVNALAWLVVDRSGRLLAFALLGSGTLDNDEMENDLDGVATGLAQLG
ncbi:MAG: D-alanyl-D-alanine carboxypeptidase/D-alanyl-D-alanine endopeptidase [Mycobacteriales bacterium]